MTRFPQSLNDLVLHDLVNAAVLRDGRGYTRFLHKLLIAIEHANSADHASPAGQWGLVARQLLAKSTRRLKFTLPHHDRVAHAAFSPDGALVVTASNDHTARIWDARTGRQAGPVLRHNDEVHFASFNPDGTQVLTISCKKAAYLWDAATGRRIGRPLQHKECLTSANFSPDGSRVVTTSWDHTAKIWDVSGSRYKATTLEHPAWVSSASFSPDGKSIVTGCYDQIARIWDTSSGQLLKTLVGHQDDVGWVIFSPDGKRVLTAGNDSTVRLWDTNSGQPVTRPLRHVFYRTEQPTIRDAAFSPDGTLVATGGSDELIMLWDAVTGRRIGSPLRFHQSHPLTHIEFSSDGTRLLGVNCTDATVNDIAVENCTVDLLHDQGVTFASFSPDGKQVVTAGEDGTARIWDAEMISSAETVYPIETSPLRKLFDTEPPRTIVKIPDKRLEVRASVTGKPLGPPLKLRGEPMIAAVSPTGECAIVICKNRTARIWDVATGKPVGRLLPHRECWWWHEAQFSPDGTRVVTLFDKKAAQVWSAATGERIGPPLQHKSLVNHASFSPDGGTVLTWSCDNTAKLWDAATGHRVGRILHHECRISNVEFSPDGRLIVSSRNGYPAVQLWDAATGEPIGPPFPQIEREDVDWACFSPDGARIITKVSGANSYAVLWDVATRQRIEFPPPRRGTATRKQTDKEAQVPIETDDLARLRLSLELRTGHVAESDRSSLRLLTPEEQQERWERLGPPYQFCEVEALDRRTPDFNE